ncbi:hypothetical protein NECAME_08840 [Necator americanus]|uniref:TOG domain-containing protein n=1 Tax=Necator americanus TaxID=51031 RepID=W2TIE9_NECAM|nr:hypothetical protein NECAME_08840 [Necator americanus]ETN80946.1 hypothetical protein NECAME_08840 [Necator americanus]
MEEALVRRQSKVHSRGLKARTGNEFYHIAKLIDFSATAVCQVVMAVLSECKNLRSSVSRAALTCIGALTQNMKAKMDVELDKLCTILINKAGDVSNAFIREDASEALEKVVKYASASKALQSIIAAGSKSKNNTIRASCAGFVGTLVSRVGAPVLLASTDQLARLIPQLIAFCRDANAQVRMHGKQILVGLSQVGRITTIKRRFRIFYRKM